MSVEYFTYPVRGVSPQRCSEGEDHFLHMVVPSVEGQPQAMGVGFPNYFLPEPDALHDRRLIDKVGRYVGVPVARRGTPERGVIHIDPRAGLADLHLDILHNFTGLLEMRWQRFSAGGGDKIWLLTDPEAECHIPTDNHTEGPFRAQSFSVLLASLRALALQKAVTKDNFVA